MTIEQRASATCDRVCLAAVQCMLAGLGSSRDTYLASSAPRPASAKDRHWRPALHQGSTGTSPRPTSSGQARERRQVVPHCGRPGCLPDPHGGHEEKGSSGGQLPSSTLHAENVKGLAGFFCNTQGGEEHNVNKLVREVNSVHRSHMAGSGTCTMILASGVKQKKAVIKLLIIRFH